MVNTHNKPKVLVTGAGGFVGGHLVNLLARNGYAVSAVSRSSFAYPVVSTTSVTTQQMGLASPEFEALLSDHYFEYIFHFAGQSYAPYSVEHPAEDFTATLSTRFAC